MRFLALSFCFILYTFQLAGQVPLEDVEDRKYPANNQPETMEAAAVASFFETTNVGNLHIFPSIENVAPYNFYYKGEELPKGALGIFEEDWLEKLPEEFKPYAVFAIKGDAKPYYLVRFEGKGIRNTIELFEMVDGVMEHRETVARYRCEGGDCMQMDSWLQDLNGDTWLDIIKKVKIWDSEKNNEAIGSYYIILTQLEDGTFAPTGSIPVQLKDYRLENLEETP